jgi:putative ABC transport system permease protein
MMHSWLNDVRYGARMLAKSPGFTLVAILTLALGIGANTAIFSVVNSVLLRSLPWREPDRLVMIFEQRPREGVMRNVVSAADFFDWREQSRSFEQLAASYDEVFNLINGEAERVAGVAVSPAFFDLLGVRMHLGPGFRPEHETRGKHQVVVLTNGLWQRKFGADPAIIGRAINISGRSFTVVGVLPATFELPTRDLHLFVPLALSAEDRENRGGHFMSVLARLRPGVSLEQARSEMQVISANLERQHRVNRGHAANVEPLYEALVSEIRPALLILLGAVGVVLLIACANLANLLLARAVAREREISIRLALGAGRGRIARQLLLESLLLAGAAGAAGVLLAVWGVEVLTAIAPKNINILGLDKIQIDRWVLLFTAAISIVSGILFGLAPALASRGATLHSTLKEGARAALASRRRTGLRRALMAAEVAFALILLAGAGLLVRSFDLVSGEDRGFRTEDRLTMQISLPLAGYSDDAKKTAFTRALLDRLGSLSNVRRVGATSHLPASGADSRMGFVVDGLPPNPNEPRRAHWRIATPGYFEAMGVRLLDGRLFSDTDVPASQRVLIVNEAAAKRFWPGQSAVGKRARFSSERDWYQVIGVVGSVKHWGLDVEPRPEAYQCYLQTPFWSVNVVMHTAGDPRAVIDAAKAQVREMNPQLPVGLMRTMEDVVATSVSTRRFTMLLLTGFAVLALVLAAAGVYGVISYSVTQRTQEFGVRMTLGARAVDILTNVLRAGTTPVLIGVVIGLAGAAAATRLLEKFVYGVSPRDPYIFSLVAAVLVCVAVAAALIPAYRATRVDPNVALRYE